MLCALAALALPGWARERLDGGVIARFGGTYSTECGNPSAPRVRVLPDALLVEGNNRRVVGADPQASYSYLGNSPPRSFEVALLSQVRGMPELLFMVSSDLGGNYIEVEADPKIRASLGAKPGQKYRQCEATLAIGPPPPAPSQPPAPPKAPAAVADDADGAARLVAEPRFGRTWRAMLGPLAREPWIANMNGPSPPPRWVDAVGNRYVFNAFCKPHDCSDNNAVQLYNPGEEHIFGLVHRVSGETLLGNPSPAITSELRRLWRAEWHPSSR